MIVAYVAVLQVKYQRSTRSRLSRWQAYSQTREHKVDQGRMLDNSQLHCYDEMLDACVEGTWLPFEAAFQRWL